MKRSTDRILTTHVGSLPRPGPLLDRMRSGERGEEMESAVAEAVTEAVRQQAIHGVDVVTDGEQGKTGFFAYVGERLTGFESRPDARAEPWRAFAPSNDRPSACTLSAHGRTSSRPASWMRGPSLMP